ncbi:MAG: homoserine O-succinyltransferase [Chitinispirillales bacterium]|jgi:homoserine O-succinyltransferase|nr:homoserine O-succinyltransferase [Chitinispirillales bacterium]
MTIVVPKDYHGISALESSQVQCVTSDDAQREDIRALRVGILNIMPRAETYEFSLLQPLGRSVMQIEPVWIRLKTHTYTSSDQTHLDKLYVPFEEAVARSRIDGLIVTGAPVEEIPFEEVSYWGEIRRILKYARKNVVSTLGICWGGLALAKYLGMDKTVYDKKIFGVYKTVNMNRSHDITGEMDDWFWCPQSRHSGIDDAVLEGERDAGNIRLLAHADGAGYVIFESADGRFIVHLGHPEYEPSRLVEEYNRDKASGKAGVGEPVNVDMDKPANLWRSHRTEFFTQWIKHLHDETSY